MASANPKPNFYWTAERLALSLIGVALVSGALISISLISIQFRGSVSYGDQYSGATINIAPQELKDDPAIVKRLQDTGRDLRAMRKDIEGR